MPVIDTATKSAEIVSFNYSQQGLNVDLITSYADKEGLVLSVSPMNTENIPITDVIRIGAPMADPEKSIYNNFKDAIYGALIEMGKVSGEIS